MLKNKFMKVDYNMLVQNHVHYNMLSKKITLWGGGVMVKDLIPQCGSEEVRSSSLYICNLGYLGYLCDLIG
jgi:hypothetical protein